MLKYKVAVHKFYKNKEVYNDFLIFIKQPMIK